MKKITVLLTALAVFTIVISAFFTVKVDILSKKSEIAPAKNLLTGNSITTIWKLSYSDKIIPITIALRKTSSGKEYLVCTKFFEVIYAVGKEGFGKNRMNGSKKEVPVVINIAVLYEKDQRNQISLFPNEVSVNVALPFITSYLTDLLNNEYLQLLY